MIVKGEEWYVPVVHLVKTFHCITLRCKRDFEERNDVFLQYVEVVDLQINLRIFQLALSRVAHL